MTRLAKPEKKAGKGNERRGMYANRRIKAIGHKALNWRNTTAARPGLSHHADSSQSDIRPMP
jgi:hypothetical protein